MHESEKGLIAQFCPTLQPHGLHSASLLCPWILHARILEWIAIHLSRGSSWPRDWTLVSCIAGRFFTVWATRYNHHFTDEVEILQMKEKYLLKATNLVRKRARVWKKTTWLQKLILIRWFYMVSWELLISLYWLKFLTQKIK